MIHTVHILIINNHYYTARQDTLQTLHLDEISSDHKGRDMFVTHCVQNINSYELLPDRLYGYHIVLISLHCNFMLTNFMYFRIFIFSPYQ
jgi:hypothetical protein